MIRQAVINLRDRRSPGPGQAAVDWQTPVAGKPLLDSYVAHLAAFGVRSVLLGGAQAERFTASHHGRTICGAAVEIVPGPGEAMDDLLRVLHHRLDEHFLMADWPYRVCDLAAFVARPPAIGEGARRLVEGSPAVVPMGSMIMPKALLGHDAAIDRPPIQDRPCAGGVIDFAADLRNAGALAGLETVLRRPAAFLDRDGVINVDHGYVHRPEDLQFTPTAVAGIRLLNQVGYRVFVVTNQAGVAYGYYGVADIRRFHDHLQQSLLEQGAHIDGFYYSPTHPRGSVPEFTCEHEDRKPGPGMLLRAMRDWPTDIRRSFLIGDKASDIAAATQAGVTGIRVAADRCDLAAEAASLVDRFAVNEPR